MYVDVQNTVVKENIAYTSVLFLSDSSSFYAHKCIANVQVCMLKLILPSVPCSLPEQGMLAGDCYAKLWAEEPASTKCTCKPLTSDKLLCRHNLSNVEKPLN